MGSIGVFRCVPAEVDRSPFAGQRFQASPWVPRQDLDGRMTRHWRLLREDSEDETTNSVVRSSEPPAVVLWGQLPGDFRQSGLDTPGDRGILDLRTTPRGWAIVARYRRWSIPRLFLLSTGVAFCGEGCLVGVVVRCVLGCFECRYRGGWVRELVPPLQPDSLPEPFRDGGGNELIMACLEPEGDSVSQLGCEVAAGVAEDDGRRTRPHH